MIGSEGQYLIQFSLNDLTDFVREDDLHYFTVIEEAGNVLPTFELSFDSNDDAIFSQLHEGNTLQVAFGKDRDQLFDVPLRAINPVATMSGLSKRRFSTSGLYSGLDYLENAKVSASDPLSGVEVIQAIVAKTFTPDFNVASSKDSQVWLQPNCSDKKFVDDIWLHLDLTNSFAGVGISMDGRFILKDIKKDLRNAYKWRFTKNIRNDNDLPYDQDFILSSLGGFVNAWHGYGRERRIYNMATGEDLSIIQNANPLMAITSAYSQAPEVSKRFGGSGVLTSNMHANYWDAYSRNIVNLAAFGKVKLTLSFNNRFVPIRVLDQVMFIDDDIQSARSEASEFNSGVYYVSKVVRSIQNRIFCTIVELCRESLNQLK